jgi:hypothetical protein
MIDVMRLIYYISAMECLKQTVKSKQVQDLFRLPNSFLDYDELEIIIMPFVSDNVLERDKRDIDIINANADRLNREAEENLLFQVPRSLRNT